jgi:hypothetical protein
MSWSRPVPWSCHAARAFLAFLAGALLAPSPARADGCASHAPRSLVLIPPAGGSSARATAPPAPRRHHAPPARPDRRAPDDSPCRGPHCSGSPRPTAPAPAPPPPPTTGHDGALLHAGQPPADPPPFGRVRDEDLFPPPRPGPTVYHPPR